MIKYGYQCDICGADFDNNRRAAPPVSLWLPEGHFQSCPECATAETKRLQLLQQQTQESPQNMNPENLRAAADRMEQIALRKKATKAEPDPEADYPDQDEEPEDEPLHRRVVSRKEPPPPAMRRRAREYAEAAARPARRSRLAEAQDRFEIAMDAFEAAEEELLAATDELDRINSEVEERRERFLSRYRERETSRPARPPAPRPRQNGGLRFRR